jgi:predicted negative regulator of RcsB-dependent stress response
VYDSYAEALLVKGDKKNAIINYEKAFQMDPTICPQGI